MDDPHPTPTDLLPEEAEQYEWIVMKSLIDSHEQMMAAMEQHALSSMTTAETSNEELITQLKSAQQSHRRAIEDLDTAIAALREKSQARESATNAFK